MMDKIINVAIAVICLIAAGQCGKYSAAAFMGKGKIPLNVYSLVKDGQKKDLSKMSEDVYKRQVSGGCCQRGVLRRYREFLYHIQI